ncbi:MAG TPA: peptidoglycan DD-metalloendopeptidase family protein, partial [Anaerolineaceae bacterium]|nr:peptidoglycan DD-metalloendopeptidase family protein [Anaerolineaceae bacterium]
YRCRCVDQVNWPLADYRYGYVFPNSTILHTGIDIDAPQGTPVIAAASGRVVWAGYGLLHGDDNPEDPYGLAVMIRHDFGYEGRKLQTVYAHMDEIHVILGQRVETGETLGLVGNTGNTTGPHLHFEVRLENAQRYYNHRNPELWLTPPQGMGVLVGRVLDGTGSLLAGVEVTVRPKTGSRRWIILSYAPWLNSDEYYQENLVLSDLPVGDYTLSFTQRGTDYSYDFSIHNGAVTYFVFRDGRGFSSTLPEQTAPEGWLPEP